MNARAELANAIRALAMDAVQAGQFRPSRHADGHGRDRGGAVAPPPAHNPANPHWANRDRFVLSNGHGSMLLYSLLHLTGYDLPMDELKRFRQLHSKTPGHPEYGCAPGVETTTGPLGQGISNAVGMALAERLLAAEFNRPGHEIVDHHTYVFLGDGCLMEGISHEACALAGTLGLGKLIAVYDDNGISIDSDKGSIRQWFTDDVRRALRGLRLARDRRRRRPRRRRGGPGARRRRSASDDRPTLICGKTVIGKGAPTKANTGGAHGAPLGEKEVAATREAIGWQLPAVRDSRRRLRRAGTRSEARQARRAALEAARSPPTRSAHPRAGRRNSCAAWRASCRRIFGAGADDTRRGDATPRPKPSPRARPRRTRSRRSRRRCPSCSAARPT